ncbi:MAG: capsular polysaccharide biosynthesis protein, partial [Alphaproteobacteria bacterium]|nr:capsular polysaccharide biosynthesis protein [Alphaproteobacteria bacterium]
MVNRRLRAYTGGFLRDQRVKRILELSGFDVRFGLPSGDDLVAMWGRRPRSWRGRAVARWRSASVLNVEDGFLRSVLTGRMGEAPQSLVLDQKGVYFDCSGPSDLEDLLNSADLSGGDLAARVEAGIARLAQTGLSKYNGFDPALEVGEDGYVLVIDQTRGDASILHGGASDDSFAIMLRAARAENPDARILIKAHPEVAAQRRRGHFSNRDLDDNMRLVNAPIAPRRLLDGAKRVYCVTSLMGFEAIIAGHRPRVFGRPFYGGWGLSEDKQDFERRGRVLSRAEIFAAVMLLYPKYYDVYRDELCNFETVVDNLEAQRRAWVEDCHGYAALGMRLWKRGHLRRFFKGAGRLLSFEKEVAPATRAGRRGLIWAGKETQKVRDIFAAADAPLLRLEDGFLRSNGLGAELVPPMSLVLDDLGIYYDPSRESRLERLLNESAALDAGALARAARLRAQLLELGLSKYNVGGLIGADWPQGKRRILVPGQVEDDASIRLGAGKVSRNIDLLARVRRDNPGAFIIYKPHPDVEAGLRKGRVSKGAALEFANEVASGVNAVAAIEAVDEVWTMTSLLGFEALLRGKAVTCLGVPFYAGWGLTTDFGVAAERRVARPSLDGLVHGVLIAYPRYFDPLTGLACPVEVV